MPSLPCIRLPSTVKHKLPNARVLHGDSMQLLPFIADASVDLIAVDPPYTMTKRGRSCRPNWMPSSMGANVFSGKIPLAEDWFRECYRVLKTGTHFYVFCNTNDLRNYLNAAQSAGFKLHNVISMIKDTGMPCRWYLKNTELILFFRKGAAKPINDMTSRDWVKVEMPTKAKGKQHLTQKPLDLMEKLITNSSSPGDIVLDPFMGSGTTGVAALKHGRRFVGIEQEISYVKIGLDRMAARR